MELFVGPEETIVGASAALRSGRLSCRELLETCLGRIDAREAEVLAWAVVDRDGARLRADEIDADRAAGRPLGPLSGISIGVKDIISVAGLPREYGVPGWLELTSRRLRVSPDDFTPVSDAPIVAELRGRGAVILGKTVSTPYAWIDPPPTRNPWALDRTPGGSSSGSAAAVACGMCLGALGSQTGGSITRPAAFCGVCGFKPTFGSRDASGILPLSPSLDHPGPIARTVGDLALLADVCPTDRSGPTTIGRLRGYFDERAEPPMIEAMDRAMDTLAGAGARIVEIPLPARFAEFAAHHYAIMSSEAAAYHQGDLGRHPDLFPPRIARLIEDGLGVPESRTREARAFREELLAEMLMRLSEVDALATPAAIGPAPDASTTGDPAFNSPWSFTGLPTVAFPIGRSPDGLPLGLQLVGRAGPDGEALLFGAALQAESAVRREAGAPDLPPPKVP